MMIRHRILFAALIAFAAPLSAQQGPAAPAEAANAEEAAVRATLQHYLDGHATGQGEHFALAMHPVLQMLWVRADSLNRRTRDEYVGGASGRPAPDEAQRRRWIEQVHVTGTAAMGVIVLDYPTARLTDYMSLLKINGEWRIVGKIFHSEPRTRPQTQ
jgi:hypothetical protein